MKHLTRRSLNAALLATTVISANAFITLAAHAQADAYPSKPITLVVPNPPGGLVDTSARLVSEPLARLTGQSVVVDNRAGASGAISIQLGAQAAPDGYTLVTLSAQNVTAMLLGTVSTDIPKELTAVCMLLSQPYLLVANPSLEANSVRELISLAKSKPLVYASSGVGTVVHLGMELFKSMAAVDITHVPYKGSGLSMIDLMAGRVQVSITNPLTAGPLVRSGKLKALAITSPQRVHALPDLPTVAESGVPGYDLRSWYGFLAPKGTPAAIINVVNRESIAVVNEPEMKNRLAA
jgi:tripartite-type tricarboxylate transporter receptor subunit TctC